MANIYKLNSGQLTSKQAILDAFASGHAMLVYFRNARMPRPWPSSAQQCLDVALGKSKWSRKMAGDSVARGALTFAC
jgi:hypothetical protein